MAWGLWHMAFGPCPSTGDWFHRALGAPKPSYSHQPCTRSQRARGPCSSLWAPIGHPRPPKYAPKSPKCTPKSPKCAPKSPKCTPKSPKCSPKSPKCVPKSTTRRPTPKNHEKRSPKHVPDRRQSMKYQGFPQCFVAFGLEPMAYGIWPMAYGICPFAIDFWLAA